MNIEDMTIGEAKKLAAFFSGGHTVCCESHGLCLVVADRGHVWVGTVETNAEWCLVRDAQIVRYWGTEHGLNQIAVQGPTSKTKLDQEAPLIKVSRKAVIALIPCTASKWKK